MCICSFKNGLLLDINKLCIEMFMLLTGIMKNNIYINMTDKTTETSVNTVKNSTPNLKSTNQ